ncbi:iron transporter [Alicyclobacillaceae bacterium I2511]|nr:iron transporter [Alicyclobacillaceae bacterium I2511]
MKKQKSQRPRVRTSEIIRDVVIGMSDGLTVPFALAAGLSGTVSTTLLVVIAGIAEIAAGAIAMGLGGFLAIRTDHEYFVAQESEQRREISDIPYSQRDRVVSLVEGWGISPEDAQAVATDICSDPQRCLNFIMKYDLQLQQPHPNRALQSSLTIGTSYIVGGLVPLAPYMLITQSQSALLVSVLVTLLALFIFGWVKGAVTGVTVLKSAAQTTMVGGTAAGIAFLAAKLIA